MIKKSQSYVMGFTKMAEAFGIAPQDLMKCAAKRVDPYAEFEAEQRKEMHLNALKHALLMAAIGGGASAALSSDGCRLGAGVAGAAGSGLLTYLANIM